MSKAKRVARNIFLPLLVHFLLVVMIGIFDPCNNNPGCMAGGMTAYFLLLFTAPTILILIIINIIQANFKNPDFNKYLKINMAVSLIPFLIAAGLMLALKVAFT